MGEKVLVTGGAGFIGSHIVDQLLAAGHSVRVLDNLDSQVHGPNAESSPNLSPAAEFMLGDVLDRDMLKRALKDIDAVYHQAALVGVGQSMYEIEHYSQVNVGGTANLLDVIVNESDISNRVRKVIVASSMSVYGEGKCHHSSCGEFMPTPRTSQQIAGGAWEILAPNGEPATPCPTDESQLPTPTSIYASNKLAQEQMVLATGRSYGFGAIALRYFGVYGPRQSLNNPYTGVAAIFTSRILNGHAPVIFEDGGQCRDFIHVHDIARANRLCLERDAADGLMLNVGAGRKLTVLDMVRLLIEHLNAKGLEPEITGRFREGDIRHCYADIGRLRELLNFEPQVRFEDGIADLAEAVRGEQPQDRFSEARAELDQRGLTK